ncbi:MAG: hypothetical protein HY360_05785 [Verrucomicrobia bacterium]|nr:hypothetical protein [Verrucomicrobiota bacterium]
MKRSVLIACLCLGLGGAIHAQSLLKVQPSTDGKDARIEVSASKTGGLGLLELLDAKSGHCIKTLHAGSFSKEQTFSIGRNHDLGPGSYRIRYRGGITLAADMELTLPGKEKWSNPTGIALRGKGVYVLDGGIPSAPPARKEDESTAEEMPVTPATYLYKFSLDGKPDAAFGDRGRAALFDKPTGMTNLAVDDKGLIYLPSGGHEVLVWSETGERMPQAIGGIEDAKSARHTTWTSGAALGPDRLIYILSGCMIRVYDRTKNGFDGFLYTGRFTHPNNFGQSIATDRSGSIYLIAHPVNVFQKIHDTGKEIKEGYVAGAEDKMYAPMGLSAGGSLVWIADHGPGPGPFWDSGGGNEIILFWDNGERLILLDRYGAGGKARDRLEFINPCATAQSPDHTELWVAEDGVKNADGPPGNARVRKFRITAAASEEIPLELK